MKLQNAASVPMGWFYCFCINFAKYILNVEVCLPSDKNYWVLGNELH